MPRFILISVELRPDLQVFLDRHPDSLFQRQGKGFLPGMGVH
jgi:hypothetical protein